MSLAVPVSEENAFNDRRRLMRGGKRLLVSAGLIALAFFFALLLIVSFGTPHDQSVALIIGDYVVTLGIARTRPRISRSWSSFSHTTSTSRSKEPAVMTT